FPRARLSGCLTISNRVYPRTVNPFARAGTKGKMVGLGDNAPYSKIIPPAVVTPASFSRKGPALAKGLTIRGYTLFEIVKQPESLVRGKDYIYRGLESGALKPIIDRTFPLADIVDAHRYMKSNQQKGKIVVTV
ncbi:MAG: zinc-binding dehydrogenase, partial [Nitrospirales bacterium]